MTTHRIAVLPENLANKIAAGEVIQRPASVVKELMENSLDAGAERIQVLLKEGGRRLIQVADDGIGMDEQDAVASFQRHATSKISSYDDLEAIRTYGFRGEALASIAAVARVTMKTRRREDDTAVVVQIEGGGSPSVSREGREPGTSIAVQNLFYNVPARLKFLKSNTTEFRHVYDAVQHTAISKPEIALDFVSDDETVFHLAPSPPMERLRDVFGDRQVEEMIPVEERTELLAVRGYIGKPTFGQRSRAHQYLFMNGRFILNRNINHAVFTAYENYLIKGTFPFFLLFLEVDPRRVDVNVHPSKMEVKFDDEQGVYRIVSALVRSCLGSAEFVPAVGIRNDSGLGGDAALRFTPRQHLRPMPGGDLVDVRTGEISRTTSGTAIAGALFAAPEERSGAPLPEPAEGPIWQIHSKYILLPIRDGLMIVDQHVAHERVLYEEAMDRMQKRSPAAQQLLFPSSFTLSPADFALVQELFPYLERLGFELKTFGRDTVVVDAMPPESRPGSEEHLLVDILSLYKEYQQHGPVDAQDALLKSFSCRSAVKAGDPLTEPEMRSLVDRLFAARMPYVCPHGRPIVMRISIDELDRRFGRT